MSKKKSENMYSKGQKVMTKDGKENFDRIFKKGKDEDRNRS